MAQKIRNPFLHTHDHDHHDHDHAHGEGHHHPDHHHDPEDPAQQSLADALRVSFGLLKWIMAVLIVVYLFTGIFSVNEQERAVRLRFGKLVGEPGEQVYGQGLHLGWPYPVEQYVKIPVDWRSMTLDRAFWFSPPPGSEGQTLDEMQGQALNPQRDGSLITGDANIVHGKFRVDYRIEDPAAFVQNVGDLAVLEQLVRNAAERAIVHVVAGSDADAVLRTIDGVPVRELMRESLDALEAGVAVGEVSMIDTTAPLSVRQAYQQAVNAESERAQQIEEARQRATSTLNEAAGEAYDELLVLVEAYETARATGDADEAQRLLATIDRALDTQQVADAQGGTVRIGGLVATTISRARTDSTAHVQRIKGDANYFTQMLERYRVAPQLVTSSLWQATREAILTGEGIESIYSPAGREQRLVIIANRDPNLKQEQERKRLQAEQDRQRRHLLGQ